MIYPVNPTPKPRMVRSDKWKQRPAVLRYRAFADEVRAHRVQIPEAGARVIFHIPMPPSWSRKKREAMRGRPHQTRPDLSNLVKAVEDAVFGEDSHIWNYAEVTKLWADVGAIEIIEESDTR